MKYDRRTRQSREAEAAADGEAIACREGDEEIREEERGAGEMTDDAQKVTIRRQWNDWKIAEAPLAALSGFRWDNFSGGVGRPSPQFHVHAYVNCDDVVGDISHSCLHGQGPHSIKVVILKKDNDREVMDHIIGIVGPRPKKAAKKKEGAK